MKYSIRKKGVIALLIPYIPVCLCISEKQIAQALKHPEENPITHCADNYNSSAYNISASGTTNSFLFTDGNIDVIKWNK